MFEEAFMVRALIAALILCPLCGLTGVYVTARRMAFFGETVAHGALAGVAVGLILGVSSSITVALFSVLIATALLWLKEKTELMTDSIMALLLSTSISLGVILMSRMRGDNRGEVHRILFGDILAVSTGDLVAAGVLAVVVMIGFITYMNELTLITANEDLALICGIPVRKYNYLFILALTLTVATSVRLVGILLVTPLLVIPSAAARNISRTLRKQIITSTGIGALCGVGGIILAYQLNVPTGPTIVLSCAGCFILTLIIKALRRPSSRKA